jgi:hypothetical protein
MTAGCRRTRGALSLSARYLERFDAGFDLAFFRLLLNLFRSPVLSTLVALTSRDDSTLLFSCFAVSIQ